MSGCAGADISFASIAVKNLASWCQLHSSKYLKSVISLADLQPFGSHLTFKHSFWHRTSKTSDACNSRAAQEGKGMLRSGLRH